jgi:filamentous hemagglutinin family protein
MPSSILNRFIDQLMGSRLSTFSVVAAVTTVFSLTPLTTVAQIVPDNSLGNENSVVTPNVNIRGINSNRIDGGAVRGGNLFHSFQEFNIREGQGAYFSNPDNIINILTRVTGGNISQILGTLGVLGNANLFFINPAGIVFGPNARLDVGGSFFATTADGILFENGFEFAASNPQAPPLLTINMPLGLNIRENPGTIVNQTLPQLVRLDESPLRNDAGFLIPQGLNVPRNQTLALIGGDVIFDNGVAISPGSRIQLGGLSEPGIIELTNVGANGTPILQFPDNIQRGNVALTNESQINVRGNGGGDVNINARNVEISGDSVIRVGIDEGLGFQEAQGFFGTCYAKLSLKCQNNKALILKLSKFLNPNPQRFNTFNRLLIPSTTAFVVFFSNRTYNFDKPFFESADKLRKKWLSLNYPFYQLKSSFSQIFTLVKYFCKLFFEFVHYCQHCRGFLERI